MRKLGFSVATMVACMLVASSVHAGFIVSADPADLNFAGPGARPVKILIKHTGSGLSTFSGYTIKFGSAANASLGLLPSGVTATSATQGVVFSGTNLFSLDPATNTVAGSGLGADSDIGLNGSATLFTLNLNVGNASSYALGADIQNAQRGGLFAQEIASEFNASSLTTDFTFTLTKAIPEPSSLSMLIGSIGIATLSRRRRVVA